MRIPPDPISANRLYTMTRAGILFNPSSVPVSTQMHASRGVEKKTSTTNRLSKPSVCMCVYMCRIYTDRQTGGEHVVVRPSLPKEKGKQTHVFIPKEELMRRKPIS